MPLYPSEKIVDLHPLEVAGKIIKPCRVGWNADKHLGKKFCGVQDGARNWRSSRLLEGLASWLFGDPDLCGVCCGTRSRGGLAQVSARSQQQRAQRGDR